MDAKTLKGIECPHCIEFIAEDDLPPMVPLLTRYQCNHCDSIYETQTEAEECCKD